MIKYYVTGRFIPYGRAIEGVNLTLNQQSFNRISLSNFFYTKQLATTLKVTPIHYIVVWKPNCKMEENSTVFGGKGRE